VVWTVVAVEDPGSFQRRLGVPVLVVVAEGGVLRTAPVGQRCEQDERFVLGEDAAPAAGGLDRLMLPGGQDVQPGLLPGARRDHGEPLTWASPVR
jgi:hypothetical protein